MKLSLKKVFLPFVFIFSLPVSTTVSARPLPLSLGVAFAVVSFSTAWWIVTSARHAIEYPNVAWYDHLIPYRIAVCVVDVVHFFKTCIRFWCLMQSNLSQETKKTIIKNDFEYVANQLLAKEEMIITELLQKTDNYNEKEELFRLSLALCQRAVQDSKSDEKLPGKADAQDFKDTLQNVIEWLKRYKLNHHGYAITNDLQENYYALYTRGAIELMDQGDLVGMGDMKRYQVKMQKSPSIKFNPRLYDLLSENSKLAVIAHEATHAAFQHGEKTYALASYMKQDNQEFQKKLYELETIHEEQADTIPSIEDKDTSLHMREFRKQNYYPGHLYIGHYNTLATVNELYKMLEWISKNDDR